MSYDMSGKNDKTVAIDLMDDLLEEVEIESQKPVKSQQAETSTPESEDAGPELSVVKDLEDLDLEWSPEPSAQEAPAKAQRPNQVEPEPEPQPEAKAVEPKLNVGKRPQPPAGENKDKTYVLTEDEASNPAWGQELKVPTSAGQMSFTSTINPSSGSDIALKQAENLRIAQDRILDLEKQIEDLRRENADLSAAGETLAQSVEKANSDNQAMRKKLDGERESHSEAVEILTQTVAQQKAQVEELEKQISEFDAKFESAMKKHRLRERELENRLELLKMETSAMIKNKNDVYLALKRELDEKNMELERFQSKGQELNRHLHSKQEVLQRTVKALRLALNMLESTDGSPKGSEG